MIATIARRELKALFASPLAWLIMAVVEFICAWLFLTQIDQFLKLQSRLASLPNAPGVTGFVAAPLLSGASIVLLMIVPLVTMRVISGERRNATLTLLTSAPVSATEIVLGKFIGIFSFLLIIILMIALQPLALLIGTHIDMGMLASGLIGLALMLGAFTAIGIYISSFTRQPVVAAVATFGVLLLLWLINLAANTTASMAWLSLMHHYSRLLRGLMNTTDIVYYVLVIAVFIIFTIRRLDIERLRP